MNPNVLSGKSKTILFPAVGIVIMLLISILFLQIGSQNSSQATASTVASVRFQGEYQIGNSAWKTIIPGEHISATKGDVTLRGYFEMLNPKTGEPIAHLASGTQVALYFNHIGATITSPASPPITFDTENAILGEDACAVMWGSYTIPHADELTIELRNPHRFGNENAIDDFLQYMSLAPGSHLEGIMLEKGATERNVGLAIVISALFILGIAAFSTIINIKYNKEMWLIGFMFLFAGGYYLFDAFAVSFWNAPNIVNTRALGLCMMLYVLFTCALIVTFLMDKYKKLGQIVTTLSGVVILLCILVSFLEGVKFYDTWVYWAFFEIAVVLTLTICQLAEFHAATLTKKVFFAIGILTLLVFPIDVLATKYGFWEGGFLSKRVFIVIFLLSLIAVLRILPMHINTAINAKKLEAEQQALKLALQESRISIMLSQMQPHFIFNTLNTIYHLCEIDPDIARKTISSFSEYLRNNIDNLGKSEMISFEKEFSFVKTYLDIEKVRFDDELEITFDIGVTNFKLPVLSIQPIVENAVKHGTSKKEGVGQLLLSTKETATHYEILIADTGVGFDPESYANDGHKHVGINNVRQRLQNLCNGTLTIESTVGVGTQATIKIPKKETPPL